LFFRHMQKNTTTGAIASHKSSEAATANPVIAIQGYAGSFHQMAARSFFGNGVQVLPCATFRQVVKSAGDKKQTQGGIMAIENSIAGSILPNYQLLQKSNLSITGEVYLQIKQHLMVSKGVALEDIREVHSHPMAILQCTEFLDRHNWKLVETEDTALSAKYVRQHNARHIAAIAGKLAATLYDLDIIAPNIHTQKNNYTRFLVVQPPQQVGDRPPVTGEGKASVSFKTDHSRGSLARVLAVVADGGINLSKLQSFPIPGGQFQYFFYADLEFDSPDQLQAVLEQMRSCTNELQVQGIYQKGKMNGA
jgi:prephenate dehydratase